MSLAERFLSEVWRVGELCSADGELTPTVLARACAATLPVDGAGITMAQGLLRIPLGASGETPALVERLQTTLGEGPCLAAVAEERPLAADAETLGRCWPVYTSELFGRTAYRSVAATPLTVPGRPVFGALNLYTVRPDVGSVLDIDEVKWEIGDLIAGILSGQLAGTDLDGHPGLEWLDTDPVIDRVMVWTAVGLVVGTTDLSEADALAALRAFAYSHELTLDDVAEQLVFERREPRTLVE